MDIPDLKDWPTTAQDAIAAQKALREKLVIGDAHPPIRTICGVDVGYDIPDNRSHASLVLMERETLQVLASVQVFLPTTFPYISGLLAFREIPVILEALKQLPQTPDVLMVDGHGIAHPRRMGIAAHLGVLLDMPAFGVGKSRLNGIYSSLGEEAGDMSLLTDRKTGESLGTVLRSKRKCNPLFISAGHRVSHETSLALTRETLRGYRLPEPTRLADKLSKVRKHIC